MINGLEGVRARAFGQTATLAPRPTLPTFSRLRLLAMVWLSVASRYV